jgi:hypothetical protein
MEDAVSSVIADPMGIAARAASLAATALAVPALQVSISGRVVRGAGRTDRVTRRKFLKGTMRIASCLFVYPKRKSRIRMQE